MGLRTARRNLAAYWDTTRWPPGYLLGGFIVVAPKGGEVALVFGAA